MARGRYARSSRGGGRNMQPQRPASVQSGDQTTRKFPKHSMMPTAKSQFDDRRQMVAVVKDGEYLGAAPADQDCVEVRLVLPGKHLLPVGLDEPTALDGIRKAHRAWITRPEPNILLIQADSISRLREAFQAVNWALHDMRLSNDHQGTQFIVQQPIMASNQDMITVKAGSRPYVAWSASTRDQSSTAMMASLSKLCADAPPSFEAIMVVEKHLKMRVNFGHLVAHRTKTKPGDQHSYGDFTSMAKIWSRRGWAGLETRLPKAQLANRIVEILTDPEHNFCDSREDIRSKCCLTLISEDHVLKAGIAILEHGDPQISTIEMMKTEHCARLNWTVAAPDMQFDWNLRVDTLETVEAIPGNFQTLLLKKIKLKAEACAHEQGLLNFPKLFVASSAPNDVGILSTQLRMSTIIPIKDTPYAVEVSATRVWKELEVNGTPDMESWSIELYGMHWEEAINYVKAGEIRKDWGEELKYMWPGDDTSLERRYGKFVQSVLEVQQALEEIRPDWSER